MRMNANRNDIFLHSCALPLLLTFNCSALYEKNEHSNPSEHIKTKINVRPSKRYSCVGLPLVNFICPFQFIIDQIFLLCFKRVNEITSVCFLWMRTLSQPQYVLKLHYFWANKKGNHMWNQNASSLHLLKKMFAGFCFMLLRDGHARAFSAIFFVSLKFWRNKCGQWAQSLSLVVACSHISCWCGCSSLLI